MTVLELRKALEQLPEEKQNSVVHISYDGGYASCGVSEVFIVESEDDYRIMMLDVGDVVIRTDQ